MSFGQTEFVFLVSDEALWKWNGASNFLEAQGASSKYRNKAQANLGLERSRSPANHASAPDASKIFFYTFR